MPAMGGRLGWNEPPPAAIITDFTSNVLPLSVVTSKRGVLLSLALSRVHALAPKAKRIGLSAAVADPDALRAWLVPQGARHTYKILEAFTAIEATAPTAQVHGRDGS